MCGICGKLSLNGTRPPADRELLQKMMDTIHHRGPDDEGAYLSGPVALGHKRLKIIDLKTGRQPISNEDGTVWIVFNGEIYNYKELRSDLLAKGHRFRTATDTEVIVHLYEELGQEVTTKLRGMFSFALWDETKRLLLLSRDRVGIKPLYYCKTPNALLFASEIKAILADPSMTPEIEPALLDRFLAYFYMPGEETLFKNIYKLSPGHSLVVQDGKPRISRYWDLRFPAPKAASSVEESAEELTRLLEETVRDHMISDVPVGVLLSGGVDSTAVLRFAVEQTDKPISTFTVGFDGSQCTDERPFARLAAQKFGAQHHEMTISAGDFLEFLPRYVWHMEEPVCEPPAIALYYVSKFAKEYVTVLLSGEGGDEAFAGYQNYRNLVWLESIKRHLGPLAMPAAKMASGLGRLSAFRRIGKYAPLMTLPLEKYYHSRTSSPFEFFNRSAAQLYTPEFFEHVCKSDSTSVSARYFEAVPALDPLDKMLYVDTKTWLPDDLLIKADKITMANSLELRVPFLDHRVLEFAASLPVQYKLRGITTKFLLKTALSKKIPKEILDRKKTGFPVPYESWLRHKFQDTVRAILTDRRTIERGYFQRSAIEGLLNQNLDHKNYSREIFSLVTLELWHRIFVDRESVVLR